MTKFIAQDTSNLHDPVTGAPVGIVGANGLEYLFAPPVASNSLGSNVPYAYMPSAVGITGGTVLGLTDFGTARTDISGTPGNGTANTTRGRAAFAAAGSTVVVTNSKVTANSTVLVQLGGADATLTSVRVTAAAGSFTVTGLAAATGTTPFDFLVVN